jgi:hypothetical protein
MMRNAIALTSHNINVAAEFSVNVVVVVVVPWAWRVSDPGVT